MAQCMVAENGHEASNCEQPATHYAVSQVGQHSVFIPLCSNHADQVRSSPDVIRAITEVRGPR